MIEVSLEEYQLAQHFASGVNHAGEVRGIQASFRRVGITATNAPEAMLRELELTAPYWHVHQGMDCRWDVETSALVHFRKDWRDGRMSRNRLFVDSGAFSEVDFVPSYHVVDEITHDDWMKRFAVYQWACEWFHDFAYLVAPDRVGDQRTTLERLARYAGAMRWFAAQGANIIIPVQKGELPMADMYREACAILDIERPIAGIPMQKDATPLRELAEFAASLPPAPRLHLLGIGPKARNNRFEYAVEAIRRARPDAQITSDSALIPSLVGRDAAGNATRVLTRYQDEERAKGSNAIGIKTVSLFRQGNEELDDWSGDDMGLERRSDILSGLFVFSPIPQLTLFATEEAA